MENNKLVRPISAVPKEVVQALAQDRRDCLIGLRPQRFQRALEKLWEELESAPPLGEYDLVVSAATGWALTCTPFSRYVLCSPSWGVYLGSFLGLGFWSRLDSAGQDCAVVFSSVEEAESYSQSWDGGCPDHVQVRGVPASAVVDGFVPLVTCQQLGLPVGDS